MKELSEFWHSIIGDAGIGGIAIALIIVASYEIRLHLKGSQVSRYEFASKNEVKIFKLASAIFVVSVTLFLFNVITAWLGMIESYQYYFIAAVCIGIGFLGGYSLSQYFKVYYPFVLDKKLSKIRFRPKRSPTTGKPMRLLNELEEDAHLTEEMINHEMAFTYDYDVWLDEDTGYKLIERFDGHLRALICPRCNFRTLRDYEEKVMESPSANQEGKLKKYYRCSYCGHEETREARIASLSENKKLGIT